MAKHHHKQATPTQPGPAGPPTPTPQAAAARDKDQVGLLYSMEEIRLSAYRKWEKAGKPAGDGIQFWLEAEQELLHRRQELSGRS